MSIKFMKDKRVFLLLMVLVLFIISCDNLTNQDDSSDSGDANDGDYYAIIDTSSISSYNGFTYEFWNQNETGDATMRLREDGSFDITWNGIYNMLARNGVRPGQDVTSITYTVEDYNVTGGISYLCVYGWFYNGSYQDLVEYYIVDNWKNWNPANNATYYNTVTVDGYDYKLYTSERVSQPSINGTATFTQYWSIRDDLRTSGSIDVPAHFEAWEKAGLTIGSTRHEVSFCIEGFGMNNTGVGYANVSELSYITQ